jgi:5'-methylthioadenosine phosphorylase
MFRAWNADVINMSSVPEVHLAREKKIHYASAAMSTDYDCWREGEESVTWEMILDTMKKNADSVLNLFLHVIPKIKEYDDVCAD